MTSVSWSPEQAAAQWPEPRSETVFVELGIGVNGDQDDAYTEQLNPSGIPQDMVGASLGPVLSVGTMFPTARRGPDFGVVLRWERLEAQSFYLGESERFSWDTRAASFGVRVRQRIWREWVAAYAQLHGGVGYSFVNSGVEGLESQRTYTGLSIGGVAGLVANLKYAGMFTELGYTYAPVLEDSAGHRHDDGGVSIVIGLRARYATRI